MGGTGWQVWRNAYDGDQDHQPIFLLQQAGIWRGVITNDRGGGWRRAGGSGTGRPVPTQGMERRVDAIPQAKYGELLGRHQHKTDFNHQCIPPSFSPGALTGISGGPDTLTGPRYHSVRGSTPTLDKPRTCAVSRLILCCWSSRWWKYSATSCRYGASGIWRRSLRGKRAEWCGQDVTKSWKQINKNFEMVKIRGVRTYPSDHSAPQARLII